MDELFGRAYADLVTWCRRHVARRLGEPEDLVHQAYCRCRPLWSAARRSSGRESGGAAPAGRRGGHDSRRRLRVRDETRRPRRARRAARPLLRLPPRPDHPPGGRGGRGGRAPRAPSRLRKRPAAARRHAPRADAGDPPARRAGAGTGGGYACPRNHRAGSRAPAGREPVAGRPPPDRTPCRRDRDRRGGGPAGAALAGPRARTPARPAAGRRAQRGDDAPHRHPRPRHRRRRPRSDSRPRRRSAPPPGPTC